MSDPYGVLGVSSNASDAQIRAAYRRLVKLHHPDHNGGSPEAARRFEAVQDAYAEILRLRTSGATGAAGSATASGRARPRRGQQPKPAPGAQSRPAPGAPPRPAPEWDADVEARLADLERQVREAREQAARTVRQARERARRAAREAAMPGDQRRPTDEELGYVTTEDTLAKILADARTELGQRYGHALEHPVVKRVTELIEGLEGLAEKLDRPPRRRD